MGLIEGLKKALATAGAQITSSSPKPQGMYFTDNFQVKAKAWGLSEKDALNVFYHGAEIIPGMRRPSCLSAAIWSEVKRLIKKYESV
jgi:hypothetical protein